MGKAEKIPEGIYIISRRKLQESEKQKDSGLEIVPTLTLEAQINGITSAAHGTLANIGPSFRNLNRTVSR